MSAVSGVGAGGDQLGDGLPGSRPVTRLSPASTASAPQAAYASRSCGPRTPDSATLTMSDGIIGAMPAEHVAVHLEGLEVAGVDPDHPGAGVDGAAGLHLVVDLDQRGHAERDGALDQRLEGVLLERGDDEQGDVGAVGPGLPELVAR